MVRGRTAGCGLDRRDPPPDRRISGRVSGPDCERVDPGARCRCPTQGRHAGSAFERRKALGLRYGESGPGPRSALCMCSDRVPGAAGGAIVMSG